MTNCIFCKIIKREIATKILYEDNLVSAFKDINPKTPIHILIIPKKHIKNIDQVHEDDKNLLGHMILVAKKIARQQRMSENGYRLVFNVKKHAGQIVDHIHLHILGGKALGDIC